MRAKCAIGAVVSALLFAAGCARERIERVEWPVMGTLAAVQFKGAVDNAAVTTVKTVFAKMEKLLNAHDEASELSRLAGFSDGEILEKCTGSVRPCYEAAFRLRDETMGLFNPRWRGSGTMDLGAIAKGYAVDQAVRALRQSRIKGAVLVDLGGNLRSAGGSWKTGIVDPNRTESVAANGRLFDLDCDVACATSAEYYRGRHIRDGRTGKETFSGIASVTVIHPNSATMADGLSTVLFLLGREKGEAFLKERYPQARAIWEESPR